MTDEFPPLDMRERIIHIDQMLADIERKHQQVRLAPWQLLFAGTTAMSAVFAAGAAVGAIFVKTFM
jgi:hypothetical protein